MLPKFIYNKLAKISTYTNRLRNATLSRSFERIKKVIIQLNSNETNTIKSNSIELP